jgi:hypothetical protein
MNEIAIDSFLLVNEGHGVVDERLQGVDVVSKQQKNIFTIVGGDLALEG